ncbi:MAG TPA: hypothetical protein VEX70_07385 [Pyrinomonadaceae bacterium]|nr:hypothetical protein [Pyrinomonadaceae bacterium]
MRNLIPKFIFAVILSSTAASLPVSGQVNREADQEPEIMTYKEYGRIRHGRPYVLQLKSGAGELLYFGAGHVYRVEDPQIAEIERRFVEFRPTVVLNESQTPPVEVTRELAVTRYGEPGLVSFLAARHNVPIKSLDPPRMQEIRYLLGTKRWTTEQVMMFYILRRVSENNKKTSPRPADELVQQALDATAKAPGFEGLPKTVAEFEASVRRLLPSVADWRTVKSTHFDPNPDLGLYTNDVAYASSQYRDRYIVKLLADEVRGKGGRVFAVVGASHVVMQEKALKKALQETSAESGHGKVK